MSKIIRIIAAIILFFHGLIHLMGMIVYLKLGTLEQFSYKTTILNGRVDLGESSSYVFGVLWAIAAIGFVVTAAGLVAQWKWNPALLVGVSIFSLVLTALDYKIAFTGVLVNIVILGLLWFTSRRQRIVATTWRG